MSANEDQFSGVPTAREIAEVFVSARLAARTTDHFPGPIPETLSASYAIQDAAIGLYPDRLVGWKVGGVPPAQQEQLGIHRVAGAIFARNVWTSEEGGNTALPAIDGGFAAIESEFVARIGPGVDPAKTEWTIDEAADAIDGMFIGVELAGSSLASINELGSTVVASDFGNNGGMIVGPELKSWRDRLDDIEVETFINGVSVGAGSSSSLAGGAVESVRFLLEHCARWGRPLKQGDLISTGAVTGVHRAYIGDEAVCRFKGVGDLNCSLVRAEPN